MSLVLTIVVLGSVATAFAILAHEALAWSKRR
jgi:hypothetical protein